MKLRTLVLVSAVLLAAAGSAVAQMAANPQPAPAPTYSGAEMSVSGKVVRSSSTELVVDADNGQRMTFVLDNKTFPSRTFSVGDRASVRYHSLTGSTGFHAAGVAPEPMAKVETSAAADSRMPADTRDENTTLTNNSRLPETASAMPLLALFGFLALGGAIVLRVTRN